MVQPIQYQIPGALTPFENLVSGLKLGTTMADMDVARAQQEAQIQLAQQKAAAEQAAMQRAQRYDTALSTFLAKPNRTWMDFEAVTALATNPEQLNAIKTMAERFDKDKLQSQQKLTSNVLLAYEADPAVANRLLDERIAAEQDPQQKQMLQTVRQVGDIDPKQAANMLELGGAAIFGKDWYEGIVKVRDERRAAAKAPFELRQAEAKAIETEATALNAPAKAAADAMKAVSDAQKSQIELETLRQLKQQELAKATTEAQKSAIEAKYAEHQKLLDAQLTKARIKVAEMEKLPANVREALWLQSATPEQKQAFAAAQAAANPPKYDAQAGGFIVPPSPNQPQGGFIPLTGKVTYQDQQAALKALKTAGYDPETGKDAITRLIQKSTSGGMQSLVANTLGYINVSTSGAEAIQQLATVGNAMALDLLSGRLGAGISNADRDFIVSTLGDIANPKLPADTRVAAWLQARNRMITSGMIPPPSKPAQIVKPATATQAPQPPAAASNPYQNMSNDELLRQLGMATQRTP